MFATTDLARRIEHAEACLSADAARSVARRTPDEVFVHWTGGGCAVRAGDASPFNKVIGVGFDGPPHDPDLDEVERLFRQRGEPVRAEVSTLADPAWCARLTGRGYVLDGFENVLGMEVPAGDRACDMPPGLQVTEATDDATWIDVVIRGFEHPDPGVVSAPGEHHPREVLERVFADIVKTPGFTRYLATIDGVVAGGASMRLDHGVAQLSGAATLPAFRRRGIQTSLLNRRLRDAARQGCDVAVVTTQPGSRSQQNVQRRGFALLYARAILVRTSPCP